MPFDSVYNQLQLCANKQTNKFQKQSIFSVYVKYEVSDKQLNLQHFLFQTSEKAAISPKSTNKIWKIENKYLSKILSIGQFAK